MNIGKTLFAQLMDFLPWSTFARIVARYGGDARVRTLCCAEQYRAMAFAQLTYRESLRARPQGLPRQSLRPLLSPAPVVRRPAARARRRTLRPSPQNPGARHALNPRRLGLGAAHARAGARSPGDSRRPAWMLFHHCAFRRSRSLVPTHRDQAFRSIASSVAWVREGTVGCLC